MAAQDGVDRFIASTHGVNSEGLRVDLRAGRHRFAADEPPSAGGEDAGPNPFGLLASGLIACTAITTRMYADRKGWPLEEIKVDVRVTESDDGSPTVHRRIRLVGDLDDDQRRRLAEVAERTPVTLAIRDGLPIETTYREGPSEA